MGLKQEYFVRRSSGILVPHDLAAEEAIKKLPEGVPVRIFTKRVRIPEHSAKFWAISRKVYDNQQTNFPTVEKMVEATKLEVGHTELLMKLNGEQILIPSSIAFSEMHQDEFEVFYDKALDVYCVYIIPGMDRATLEREIR